MIRSSHRAVAAVPTALTALTALAALAALAGYCSATQAAAAPVTITTPFMKLEHRAVNSLGFSAGELIRFGADSVVPNGGNGTTGLATNTAAVTGAALSRTIILAPPSGAEYLLSPLA